MKRGLSLTLALLLVLSVLPVWNVPASALASPDLEALVGQQINAYANSIYQVNSDEDAALYFADHAVTKRGAALHADEKHIVTACLYTSNLLKVVLADSCASLIETMQQLGRRSIYGKGGCNWRSYADTYSMAAYQDAQVILNEYLASVANSKTRYGDAGYTGALNAHDETLLWTVGSANITIDMSQASVSADTVTYNVTVVVSDRFDFDGTYENAKGDATFEKVVTLLGSGLGKLMFKEYDWDSTVSFQLTVPNPCTHSSGSYHWTYDANAKVLTSDGSGDFLKNNATQHYYSSTSKTTGVTTTGYYHELDASVHLNHDQPWVVEYTALKPQAFSLAPLNSSTTTVPYFLTIGLTSIYGVQRERVKLTEAEKEAGGFTSVNQWYTHYYGTNMRENFTTKYSSKHTYTVRMENVIAEDGSNMVYVSVYNEDRETTVLEPTALNDYYLTVPGGKTRDDQGMEADWISGVDFIINYIGNKSYRLKADAFDITIWENGVDAASRDTFATKVVAPTCSAEGYTAHTCEHCGYTYKTDIMPTTAHSYAETVTPPSCTKDGYTTHTCTVCGDSYRTDTTAAAGHSHTPTLTAPTCTAQGCTTYTCACGDSYVAEYVDATGHSFVDYVSDGNATCTEDGTKTAKCVRCDVTDTQPDPGSATGHHGGEANCFSKPKCEACGIVCGEMDPANHAGGEEVRGYVEPQEFKQGFTGHTYCKGCGEKLVSGTLIPSTHVHSYGEWRSDPEQHWQECACGEVDQKAVHVPGPEATATESLTCSVCGYEIAAQIPHTHQLTKVEGFEPTQTENGQITHYTCTCGKWFEDEAATIEIENHDDVIIPALGGAPEHILGDVNGDGSLSAKDATLILRYAVKKYTDYPDWFEEVADVNGDGEVNAKDATMILRYAVGKTDIPGWEK